MGRRLELFQNFFLDIFTCMCRYLRVYTCFYIYFFGILVQYFRQLQYYSVIYIEFCWNRLNEVSVIYRDDIEVSVKCFQFFDGFDQVVFEVRKSCLKIFGRLDLVIMQFQFCFGQDILRENLKGCIIFNYVSKKVGLKGIKWCLDI